MKKNDLRKNYTRCNEYIREYLMLDKGERVPGKLSRHLLFCCVCRSQVKALRRAERYVAIPLKIKVPVNDKSIESILESVAPLKKKKQGKAGFYTRLLGVVGIVMIVLFFGPSAITRFIFDSRLSAAYAVIAALLAIAYCFAFVLGNIDFFIKRIASKLLD